MLAIGLAPSLAPYAERAPGHFRLCRYMAEFHGDRHAVSLRCLADAEECVRTADGRGRFDAAIRDNIPRYRHQAEFHARMRDRWGLVALQPWSSLRAELAADVAAHPPDAVWRTLEYGFPPEIGGPAY